MSNVTYTSIHADGLRKGQQVSKLRLQRRMNRYIKNYPESGT
jgi:hypothetical protein